MLPKLKQTNLIFKNIGLSYFLRGAFVNLREEKPVAHDVFISYAHQDRAAADRNKVKELDPKGLVHGF